MIKYTIDQIKERIVNPKKKELIESARNYADKINMHVTGNGLDKHFERLTDTEDTNTFKLREKYARSNKPFITSLLRPLDKVYTAKGFAKYYNLSEASDKKFSEILSNVRSNQSLQDWCSTVWKRKKITDPNGIIFIETSKDGQTCYPTYKSIHNILDFDNSGTLLDLVIFEGENIKGELDYKKIRVIDSEYDYMFKVKGEEVEEIPEETFKNYFRRVPGRIISGEFDENTGYALSFIDPSIEILNEILEDNSVKIIFKRKHGYGIYWEIERKCPVCNGIGLIDGVKCHACGGDGKRRGKDVSDKIIVTLDTEGKAAAMPPAGYITTDAASWAQMNTEEDLMSKLAHKVQWGTLALISDHAYKTATGVITDTQPVYDKLHEFSIEAEDVEKFITDLIGQFYFGLFYKGSTIIYGKRYQIESPDQLLKRLAEAKAGNIPEQTIRNIYIEYLQTQYGSDSFEMSKQMRMFLLDYYPIWTASELKDLGINSTEIYKKLFYWEWVKTLSNNEILFITEDVLKSQRDFFVKEKLIDVELNNTQNAEIQ